MIVSGTYKTNHDIWASVVSLACAGPQSSRIVKPSTTELGASLGAT